VADGCFDVVKNRFPASVSANRPTVSVSTKGAVGEFVPANSQFYSITTATNLVPSYPLTVSCWARIDSVSAGGCLYSLNGTGYSAILGLLSSAFLVNQASAQSTNIAAYGNTGLHHIVCVHRATSFSLYVDGALLGQATAANYWGSPPAGNNSIGNRLNGSSPQYFDGQIQDLIVIAGDATEDDAKSLYNNHWQVFKPARKQLFVPAAAGGSATATASFASVALTPVSGSATGNAVASGSFSALNISPQTGTASTGSGATASGSFATVTLSPASATASGSATAAGGLTAITLSPATGTASGGAAGNASASCSFSPISISPVVAVAIGSAMAQGGFPTIGITAATGSASGTSASGATASGSFASITLAAATGTAMSGTLTRAPAGQGPIALSAAGQRPEQITNYRPSNAGGQRL
jgi:hypothetical protein